MKINKWTTIIAWKFTVYWLLNAVVLHQMLPASQLLTDQLSVDFVDKILS